MDTKLLKQARSLVVRAERRATSGLRALPDFVIVGAMKAGTTSLFDWLCRHPSVSGPLVKEPQYFTLHFEEGESWYRSHFPTEIELAAIRRLRGVAMTGEATPYSLVHPLAPERIKRTVPNARLLVLLRDPVTRAWSHYRHSVRHGREPLSFEEAIAAEPERLKGELERLASDPKYVSMPYQTFSYVTRGRYAEQLERYRIWFGARQMLVIKSEDMFSAPDETWRQVLEFLGLPHVRRAGDARVGSAPSKSTMDEKIRGQLIERFEPENQKLYALLGRDLAWRGIDVS